MKKGPLSDREKLFKVLETRKENIQFELENAHTEVVVLKRQIHEIENTMKALQAVGNRWAKAKKTRKGRKPLLTPSPTAPTSPRAK